MVPLPVNLTVYSCTLTLTLTLTALTHEHRRTRRSTDDACNGASLGSLSTSELPGWCQEPERYSAARCANAKWSITFRPATLQPSRSRPPHQLTPRQNLLAMHKRCSSVAHVRVRQREGCRRASGRVQSAFISAAVVLVASE